jgi:hypothetical protein
MTMLEKVARALAMSVGGAIVGPGQSRATREFGWKIDGVHFKQYVEAHWKEYIHAAGFAVSAMREPTEAMVLAGAHHENTGDMAGRWRAMVDVALAEEPHEEEKRRE